MLVVTLVLTLAIAGCGQAQAPGSTAGQTAVTEGTPTTPTTSASTTGSQPGATTGPTSGTTVTPPSGGPTTTVAEPTDTFGGTYPPTTIFTGTTQADVGSVWKLTFLGPATRELWKQLRATVSKYDYQGDPDAGQKVLDDVAKLAAGPAVEVGSNEVDSFSGLGFAAGASASQAIGVATGDDGHELLIYAFAVAKKPEDTTIAGFDRVEKVVALVEGPLPINSSTQNITTIPGQ